jgi:hypothetical protein
MLSKVADKLNASTHRRMGMCFHFCTTYNDMLLSHGAKPTWGFHKVKLRKLWLSGTLPASNSKEG